MLSQEIPTNTLLVYVFIFEYVRLTYKRSISHESLLIKIGI